MLWHPKIISVVVLFMHHRGLQEEGLVVRSAADSLGMAPCLKSCLQLAPWSLMLRHAPLKAWTSAEHQAGGHLLRRVGRHRLGIAGMDL